MNKIDELGNLIDILSCHVFVRIKIMRFFLFEARLARILLVICLRMKYTILHFNPNLHPCYENIAIACPYPLEKKAGAD